MGKWGASNSAVKAAARSQNILLLIEIRSADAITLSRHGSPDRPWSVHGPCALATSRFPVSRAEAEPGIPTRRHTELDGPMPVREALPDKERVGGAPWPWSSRGDTGRHAQPRRGSPASAPACGSGGCGRVSDRARPARLRVTPVDAWRPPPSAARGVCLAPVAPEDRSRALEQERHRRAWEQVLRFEEFAAGMATAASRVMVDGPGRGMKTGMRLDGEEVQLVTGRVRAG